MDGINLLGILAFSRWWLKLCFQIAFNKTIFIFYAVVRSLRLQSECMDFFYMCYCRRFSHATYNVDSRFTNELDSYIFTVLFFLLLRNVIDRHFFTYVKIALRLISET